jgi:hypothetical protein
MRHEWTDERGPINPCLIEERPAPQGGTITTIHCTADQGAREILRLAEVAKDYEIRDSGWKHFADEIARAAGVPEDTSAFASPAEASIRTVKALAERVRELEVEKAQLLAWVNGNEAGEGLAGEINQLHADRSRLEEENRRLREALAELVPDVGPSDHVKVPPAVWV